MKQSWQRSFFSYIPVIAIGSFSTPVDENAVIKQGNYTEQHCLDPDQIRVISWNLAKGRTSDSWKDELSKVSPEIDLLILQEAFSSKELHQHLSEAWKNYGMTMAISFEDMFIDVKYGNAIISKTTPSPSSFGFKRSEKFDFVILPQKITVFARFCLAGMDKELLVVNMHSLNFTEVSELTGILPKVYQNQLEATEKIVKTHKGPVIFAGDLNTWHPQRDKILRKFMESLDLEEVIFENGEENVWTFWGLPFDYIFVRGLFWRSARVLSSWKGSDHYPLFADLFIRDNMSDEHVFSRRPLSEDLFGR